MLVLGVQAKHKRITFTEARRTFISYRYFVLLMLTDGIISDMAQTKEAIVNVRKVAVLKFCLLLIFTLLSFLVFIYHSFAESPGGIPSCVHHHCGHRTGRV